MNQDWIIPDWPVPGHIKALFTSRNGGVSGHTHHTYRSLNLGMHVNDHADDVLRNRAFLEQFLPSSPMWLKQVHGTAVVCADDVPSTSIEGDAAYSRTPGKVCAIMVADCLPVFLCDRGGSVVGVVHAGWRGLAAGVIEQTLATMRVPGNEVVAWLGPAIGPDCFEVGEDVYAAFVQQDARAALAFVPREGNGISAKKWLADIFLLARQRLERNGVIHIGGGGICTFSHPERFYSYRRDGETGRMAALIWLESVPD